MAIFRAISNIIPMVTALYLREKICKSDRIRNWIHDYKTFFIDLEKKRKHTPSIMKVCEDIARTRTHKTIQNICPHFLTTTLCYS